MDNCFLDSLSDDILNDCDNLSIGGIESDLLIIPHSGVDKTASTINTENRILLDELVLKAGAAAYKLEGVKQLNGYNYEFVPGDENTLDKWRHTITGVILTPSAANRLQASKLGKGESYMVVVNKKYKGADSKDAFLVLGWDAGLYLTAMTENSNENDAAINFTLASKDQFLEKDMPRLLLESDYDTTLLAFNNKFVPDGV